MRTPREILLERHEAAGPRLDIIRRSAVAAVCDRRVSAEYTRGQRSPTAATILCRTLWCELIRPARGIWAGLAATWLLILVANLNFRAGMPQMTATASRHAADFIQVLQEQDQMMAELTGQPELKAPEPPKPSIPRPRSECRSGFFTI